MVDLSGDWVSAAQANALYQHAVGHFKLQESIGLDANVSHGLGLSGSAGEAVEEPALGLDLRFAQLGLHHANHNAVRHKSAFGHVLLGLLSEGGASLDLLTQDVAGADVDHSVGLGDELALRACKSAIKCRREMQEGGAHPCRHRVRRR